MKFNEWIVFLSSLGSIVLVFGGFIFAIYKYLKSKRMNQDEPNTPICEIIIVGDKKTIRINTSQGFGSSEFEASEKNLNDLILQINQAKNTLQRLA